MDTLMDLRRFAKGARAHLDELKLVLHPDSVLCPDCGHLPLGDTECHRCGGAEFVLPPSEGDE